MGKTYTVSFDSTSSLSGTNNSNRSFVTNWDSILPEGKEFKVSFSYMSAATVVANGVIMALHVNVGQTTAFAASGGPLASTRFMGYLLIGSDNVSEYYYATTTTNHPMYIKSRPPSSTTEISLEQGLTQTNYALPVPSDYVLTIFFEEL